MFEKLSRDELDRLQRELDLSVHHLRNCRDIAKELIQQSWIPKFVVNAQKAVIKRTTILVEEFLDMQREIELDRRQNID